MPLTRLDCPIDPSTQHALRRLRPATGSHTETIRHAIDLLALVSPHLDAGAQLVTADGTPITQEHP